MWSEKVVVVSEGGSGGVGCSVCRLVQAGRRQRQDPTQQIAPVEHTKICGPRLRNTDCCPATLCQRTATCPEPSRTTDIQRTDGGKRTSFAAAKPRSPSSCAALPGHRAVWRFWTWHRQIGCATASKLLYHLTAVPICTAARPGRSCRHHGELERLTQAEPTLLAPARYAHQQSREEALAPQLRRTDQHDISPTLATQQPVQK